MVSYRHVLIFLVIQNFDLGVCPIWANIQELLLKMSDVWLSAVLERSGVIVDNGHMRAGGRILRDYSNLRRIGLGTFSGSC